MSVITKLSIKRLQRLRNVDLDFPAKGVVAIMGPNGTGKTTILHALASVYRPDTKITIPQQMYKASDFFIPYDGNSWDGSEFSATVAGHVGAKVYAKRNGRWSPGPNNRVHRYVKFISLADCVPDIEREPSARRLKFSKGELSIGEAKYKSFLRYAGDVLRRSYTQLNEATKTRGLKKFLCVSVDDRSFGTIEYPSHYMGAGENKIFYLINEIIKAPKGALIIIEELDVYLHEWAIRSFLTFMLAQAEEKSLQIIFTSHWVSLLDFRDKIEIFTLYAHPDTHVVEVQALSAPDAIYAISGDRRDLRRISVWTEDGIARRIVQRVAEIDSLVQYIEFKTFGPIDNAFTIAAATVLSGDGVGTTVVVIDGDKYELDAERVKRINIVLNGDDHAESREKAKSLIVSFRSSGKCPENFLIDLAKSIVSTGGASQWLTDFIRDCDREPASFDAKKKIAKLAEDRGVSIDNIANSLILTLSDDDRFIEYASGVRDKLRFIAQSLGLKKAAA